MKNGFSLVILILLFWIVLRNIVVMLMINILLAIYKVLYLILVLIIKTTNSLGKTFKLTRLVLKKDWTYLCYPWLDTYFPINTSHRLIRYTSDLNPIMLEFMMSNTCRNQRRDKIIKRFEHICIHNEES